MSWALLVVLISTMMRIPASSAAISRSIVGRSVCVGFAPSTMPFSNNHNIISWPAAVATFSSNTHHIGSRAFHHSAYNKHKAIKEDGTANDDAFQHRKSYHVQGASTTPAPSPESTADPTESTTQKTRRNRRPQSCGPGVTMTTVNTHHTLQTDLPKAMGGTNTAPQPVETLLAALLGCTQATALFVGRQTGIVISKMEFDITAYRDERGALEMPIDVETNRLPEIPSRLQELRGTVTVVSPQDLTPQQLTVLQEQTEARCPVANMMIASGCDMTNVEWIHRRPPHTTNS